MSIGSLSISTDSYLFRMFSNGYVWAIISMWNPEMIQVGSWFWESESLVPLPHCERCPFWKSWELKTLSHLALGTLIPVLWSSLEALMTRHWVSLLSRVEPWSPLCWQIFHFLCQSMPDSPPCLDDQIWIHDKRMDICSVPYHWMLLESSPNVKEKEDVNSTGVCVCLCSCAWDSLSNISSCIPE